MTQSTPGAANATVATAACCYACTLRFLSLLNLHLPLLVVILNIYFGNFGKISKKEALFACFPHAAIYQCCLQLFCPGVRVCARRLFCDLAAKRRIGRAEGSQQERSHHHHHGPALSRPSTPPLLLPSSQQREQKQKKT